MFKKILRFFLFEALIKKELFFNDSVRFDEIGVQLQNPSLVLTRGLVSFWTCAEKRSGLPFELKG